VVTSVRGVYLPVGVPAAGRRHLLVLLLDGGQDASGGAEGRLASTAALGEEDHPHGAAAGGRVRALLDALLHRAAGQRFPPASRPDGHSAFRHPQLRQQRRQSHPVRLRVGQFPAFVPAHRVFPVAGVGPGRGAGGLLRRGSEETRRV